jgi:hypothetical protein
MQHDRQPCESRIRLCGSVPKSTLQSSKRGFVPRILRVDPPLTDSMEFIGTKNYPWLADAYLERARSNLAARNDANALADIEAAFKELEKQRARLTI